MITKSDVKKLSVLARIEISEKEEDALAVDLRSILAYFEKLKEIPSDNIPEDPESSIKFGDNLRRDIEPRDPYANAAGLTEVVSSNENGYVKVKPVFDRVKLDF